MQKKFETNRIKIKGSCQSGRKVVTHNPKSDLTLHIMIDIYVDKHFVLKIDRVETLQVCPI